jgi:hypothetical protein
MGLVRVDGVGDDGGIAGFLRALRRPKVLRTCRACHVTWKVPRYFASAQRQGALEARSRSPLAGRRGRAVATRRAREMADVRAAYGHCPHCGEGAFSQRRLWVQSKETYLGIERS